MTVTDTTPESTADREPDIDDTAHVAPANQSDPGHDVVDELLVEEISIDGMCGVY